MEAALHLAALNVKERTGGPFGAAVFDLHSHQLLAVGVNLVVPARCSVAHAELVAIMIGQQILGRFDFGGAEGSDYELVTSTEPCAMCFGAIPWSGLRQLVCGARSEDARSVGFDEGIKPADWVTVLREKKITVVRDVCRPRAVEILKDYRRCGGIVYNPCRRVVASGSACPMETS